MNRINQKNLENLQAFYGTYQAKKAGKEEKKEDVKPAEEFQPKKVEANALDVLAAQNKAAQLGKLDTSDAAVEKRLQEAFANSAFMKSLNELQGIEEDFTAFAMANITGVNHEKLAQYLNKPLNPETVAGTQKIAETLIA